MINNYLCFIQFYVQLTYLLTILINEHLILKLDLNFQLFIIHIKINSGMIPKWWISDTISTMEKYLDIYYATDN